ncbi:hypothetical protein V6N11_021487 [Hibiscus sabdariffa]
MGGLTRDRRSSSSIEIPNHWYAFDSLAKDVDDEVMGRMGTDNDDDMLGKALEGKRKESNGGKKGGNQFAAAALDELDGEASEEKRRKK